MSPGLVAVGAHATTATDAVGAADAADAAVRWRMRAARVDNLLVYGGYLLACAVLHWRVATAAHLIWLAVAGVAYHFVLESRGGQTVGKRRYGIRVVAADGGPASARAIAIRSLVRVIDSLPVCYVSGLISMVRTGPARRQRIGDIAAGTIVVAVDGRAVRQGTPGWMLPVATIAAVIVSALTVIGIAEAGHQPIDSLQASEFIDQCQNSATGAVVDCRCLLNQLEAGGYDTPDALNNFMAGVQSEESAGTMGPYRTTLRNALVDCRS
ncbi:MAG: RDD family protein [Solirubrobacterales bacterium]|nr:RDD family protein [Solirubrobacterales bacterium]